MNIRNLLGFAFGPATSAVVGLILVPVMAWNFSAADIGRLNILQVALSFVLLLSVLGLDQAYVREYNDTAAKGQLLWACFAPGLALLLTLGAVSLIFSENLAYWLYGEADSRLYYITLAAFISNFISRFLSLILRMQERGWAYSVSQALPKIMQLALVLSIVPLGFNKKFIHLQAIILFSSCVVVALYFWNTRRICLQALHTRINWQQLKSLFSFGVPLIFSSAAYWALTATSVIMLKELSSLDELAVYSMANNFAGAAVVFQSIFSVIWAPKIYKWISLGHDLKIVDQISRQALAVICVIFGICGSLSWVCDLLLPANYYEVKYLLLCMLIPPLLYTLSEVTCIGIGISRRTGLAFWITLSALLCSIILNFLLIPTLGAAGAAIANAIAFSVFFLGRTEISARIWRKFPRSQLYLCVACLLILAIAMVGAAVLPPLATHGICGILLGLTLYVFSDQFRQIAKLLGLKSI